MKIRLIDDLDVQKQALWEKQKIGTSFSQLRHQMEYECVGLWTYCSSSNKALIYYALLDEEGNYASAPSQFCINVRFDESDKSWVPTLLNESLHLLHPEFKILSDKYEDLSLYSDVRRKLAELVTKINSKVS